MNELAQQARQTTGIRLSPGQLTSLEQYEKILMEWNARMNLTAIQDPATIRTKHFLDSLTCLTVMRDTPLERVIDIGTGAGFPGIPLKIALPAMRLTLVESVGKKVEFCRHVVQQLKLEGVEIIQARAEEVGQMAAQRERYDWAVARAVALLPILAEYLLPLVKVGGTMLAMKGESAHAEAVSAHNAIQILGGQLRRVAPVTLPGVVEQRYLVVIEKIAATPQGYPRRTGSPAKKPL
jgi:16S rRNA (guanine527-N7)-methyltransferase